MYITVFITAPDRDSGRKIARHLLERRLAACVNMTPVSSMYWWEGKIEEADEVLLVVKTTTDKLDQLVKEAKAVHPYQVPEVIAVPVVGGLAEYLDWVRRETHA
ncbi:divalent-cation tolerance protein CutA [Pyrobaculum neutrophilum]|uniref:CutA1 divalent ion tolerance protein n=1 Tax=Pyrobaculum neutrophilum (strain DSM 2338 / JCM 9278 / NBRC 100436 / V24Sta) TaxID=444157 RepID=B1Y9G9_PYRNV|nr:divalent-cation tolerance protein CutA [Pyrobaculum neutrophilum]ACB40398.1 CutA1 divalent ion tolerance protein [Pyrobaculum neutrophilum V24Sta]